MHLSVEIRSFKKLNPFLAIIFIAIALNLAFLDPIIFLKILLLASLPLLILSWIAYWFFFYKSWTLLQKAINSVWDDQKLEDYFASHPQLQNIFGNSQEFIKHWQYFRGHIKHTTPQSLSSLWQCLFVSPPCDVFSIRELTKYRGKNIGNQIGLKLSNRRIVILMFDHSFNVTDFRGKVSDT